MNRVMFSHESTLNFCLRPRGRRLEGTRKLYSKAGFRENEEMLNDTKEV
jgi:hypothetical protein